MLANRDLRSIANRQWGYFTARQAVATGYGKDLQSYHARSGNWLKTDRALYRLPGYMDTLESEFVRWSLWAAGQSEQRLVVISHRSALHYYGLSPEKPACTELTVSSFKHNAPSGLCRLHLNQLAAHEISRQTGFSLTTPLRTLTDLRPDLILARTWSATVRLACNKNLIRSEEAAQLLNESMPVLNAPAACPAANAEARASHCGGGGWRTPARSFTLVEMLVVVAIICILMALLMPTLRSAVNMARQGACANNHKQFMSALHAYLQDNYETFPPETWGPYWLSLKNRGYLPAQPTYFAALCEGANVKPTGAFTHETMGFNRQYTNYCGTIIVTRLPRITQLSQRAFFACTRGEPEWSWNGGAAWYNSDQLGYWHNAEANIAYLDCHVGSVSYVELPLDGTAAYNKSPFFNPKAK